MPMWTMKPVPQLEEPWMRASVYLTDLKSFVWSEEVDWVKGGAFDVIIGERSSDGDGVICVGLLVRRLKKRARVRMMKMPMKKVRRMLSFLLGWCGMRLLGVGVDVDSVDPSGRGDWLLDVGALARGGFVVVNGDGVDVGSFARGKSAAEGAGVSDSGRAQKVESLTDCQVTPSEEIWSSDLRRLRRRRFSISSRGKGPS